MSDRIAELRRIWDRFDCAEDGTEEQDEAGDAFDAVFLNGPGMAELFDEIERLRGIGQRAKDGLRVGSVTCHDTTNGQIWDQATYILTGEKVNVLKR